MGYYRISHTKKEIILGYSYSALFMTTVTITYILYDPIGINLSYNLSVSIGIGMAIISNLFLSQITETEKRTINRCYNSL